jgi:hypothetical protein
MSTGRTDVLVVQVHSEAGTSDEWRQRPMVGYPAFRLPNGVLVAAPKAIDTEEFMDACERGLNFSPKLHFRARFLFLREDAPGGYGVWDEDQSIVAAMAMTRLVVPHSYSTEYAGSIVTDPLLGRSIEPVSGPARWCGFTPQPMQRNWLDRKDAEAVANLLRHFDEDAPRPERVRRALWLHEYLARVGYLEIAWPLTVTALDALTNTNDRFQRAVFTARVEAMAEELSVAGVDADLLDRAYKTRSKAVHGLQGLPYGDDPEASRELFVLQSILRAAIRRAIESPDWAANFADDAVIRKKWPS